VDWAAAEAQISEALTTAEGNPERLKSTVVSVKGTLANGAKRKGAEENEDDRGQRDKKKHKSGGHGHGHKKSKR